MGYRSDVRIMTSKKGFEELRKYTENYLAGKNWKGGNLLDDLDVDKETTIAKFMGWNQIKWYTDWEEYYADVMAIEKGLDYLEDKQYSYRFARIGENNDDYEERYFDGENDENYDLEYPSMIREFDDEYVKEQMDYDATN